MNLTREHITKWLGDPSQIGSEATETLERAIRDYPGSALLHMLYLKGLQNQESYLSTAQLKHTALLMSNRPLLRKWTGTQLSGSLTTEEQNPTVKPVQQVSPPTEPAPRVDSESVAPSPVEKPDNPFTQEKKSASAVPDDLSHLPQRVREVIERSRRIKEKLADPNSIVSEVAEAKETGTVDETIREEPKPVERETITPVKTPREEAAPIEEEVQEITPPREIVVEEPGETENELEEAIVFELPDWSDEAFGSQENQAKEQSVENEADIISLDFTAWLKMKQGRESFTQSDSSEIRRPNDGADTWKVEFDERPKKAPVDRKKKMDLIDRFIEKQPRIRPRMGDESLESKFKIDVSAMGSEVGDDFSTETLAQIYTQQGYYDKALSAYEILSLKYPGKSSFFADRIAEIRKLQRSSQS